MTRAALKTYYQDIDLTPSQESAVAVLEQFLNGDDNALILKGYAGTGKTFILASVRQYLESLGRASRFLAPTGRATKVIRGKIQHDAYTIHQSIYRLDPKKSKLDETNGGIVKWHFGLQQTDLPIDAVVFVDESSMVSDDYSESETLEFGSGRLLTDLISNLNCLGSRRKVVFLGDSAQLPPVTGSISPALSIEYLSQEFRLRCIEYEMTDIYRQAPNSAILHVSLNLRDSIRVGSFDEMKIVTDSVEINELRVDQVPEAFLRMWSGRDEQSAIVLAHTNVTVFNYNKSIRERLGYKPDDVVPGEQLLVVQNTIVNGHPLFNGDFIRVHSISPLYELKRIRLSGETDDIRLRFRDAVVIVSDPHGEPVKLQVKLLENLLYSDRKGLTFPELRAMIVYFKQRYPGLRQNNPLFLEALIRDPYYNAVQVKFGYAITGHKSQGGEWSDVIVDFNASMSSRSEDYFRWAYTVITRSKARLHAVSPPCFVRHPTFETGLPDLSAIDLLKQSIERELLPILNAEPTFRFIGIAAQQYALKINGILHGCDMNIICYYDKRFRFTMVRFEKGESLLSSTVMEMLREAVTRMK